MKIEITFSERDWGQDKHFRIGNTTFGMQHPCYDLLAAIFKAEATKIEIEVKQFKGGWGNYEEMKELIKQGE